MIKKTLLITAMLVTANSYAGIENDLSGLMVDDKPQASTVITEYKDDFRAKNIDDYREELKRMGKDEREAEKPVVVTIKTFLKQPSKFLTKHFKGKLIIIDDKGNQISFIDKRNFSGGKLEVEWLDAMNFVMGATQWSNKYLLKFADEHLKVKPMDFKQYTKEVMLDTDNLDTQSTVLTQIIKRYFFKNNEYKLNPNLIKKWDEIKKRNEGEIYDKPTGLLGVLGIGNGVNSDVINEMITVTNYRNSNPKTEYIKRYINVKMEAPENKGSLKQYIDKKPIHWMMPKIFEALGGKIVDKNEYLFSAENEPSVFVIKNGIKKQFTGSYVGNRIYESYDYLDLNNMKRIGLNIRYITNEEYALKTEY